MTTFNGVMDAATRSAGTGSDLALAAGQIVARRVALGMAAAFNPMAADHAELGRIVPEKMEAFSAASMIMLEQTSQAGWEITRLASDEVMTTARATIAMAGCTNPAAVAEAQSNYTLAWFNRAASNFFALGMLAFQRTRGGDGADPFDGRRQHGATSHLDGRPKHYCHTIMIKFAKLILIS